MTKKRSLMVQKDLGLFTAGFEAGKKEAAVEIARLEAENAELLCALQLLHDEQNDAPLERRRAQWELAMGTTRIALEKYGK